MWNKNFNSVTFQRNITWVSNQSGFQSTQVRWFLACRLFLLTRNTERRIGRDRGDRQNSLVDRQPSEPIRMTIRCSGCIPRHSTTTSAWGRGTDPRQYIGISFPLAYHVISSLFVLSLAAPPRSQEEHIGDHCSITIIFSFSGAGYPEENNTR